MKTYVSHLQQLPLRAFLLRRSLSTIVTVLLAAATSALIPALVAAAPLQTARLQSLQAQPLRIQAEVTTNQMMPIPGSLHPLALARNEAGRLPGATRLEGITLYFSRTSAQQADLDSLIQAQQNSASPLFHKWLTPEQFGARFGLADADIAKVQAWLESQGFQIDSIARGKSSIRFSGAASQVEAAFATELHHYTATIAGKTEMHFAPSTALSVPSALSGVVLGVRDLDDFRPRPMTRRAKPNFTSGSTSSHYLSPGDIKTIYDVTPLTGTGISGSGQTIAIMGQSAVLTSDVTAFQSAAGLTEKVPQTVLVSGTGTSTISSGDEGESDLDLEWSGALAPGADILLVYTGDSANTGGVFDSVQYTIDNNLAQIISFSYGECESDLGTANATSLEAILAQSVTQGQTIVAASGDEGSTTCFDSTDKSPNLALSVSYPASSLYVTGIGGTEFSEGSDTAGTYWTSNGTNDVITSAKSYIPETAWNDDTDESDDLASTGGGASILFAKPSWQTGVTGIPADGKRDVPDLSLDASNDHDPYLYCSSDDTAWDTSDGQTGSCVNGFRDSTATGFLTLAGGTSFATPIFAGMLALINQTQGYSTGSGLINPTLYKLAAVPATYSAAFHDITSGSNECTNSTACKSVGAIGYTAGTGYDQVTGLGTVLLNSLATAWPAATSSLIGTVTAVTASNTAPTVNTNVTFAIAVASSTGSTVPTGSVKLTLDGTAVSPVTLTSGAASYTTTFTTAGQHVLIAAYQGDSTHATSTGSASVTVTGTSSGSGTFTLTSGNITVAQGSTGSSTITVTPSGGYTGTVQFTVSTTSNSLGNACLTLANAVVTGTAAATTTLSIDTNASDCVSSSVRKAAGQKIRIAGLSTAATSNPIGIAAAAFGVLIAGILGFSSRKFRLLAVILFMATVGFALSGCGGSSSSSSTPSDPPKGTYAITVTGADTVTSSITNSVNLTLTID